MGRSIEKTWVTNPLIVSKSTGVGLVLMDTETGDCFELNTVGAEVWQHINSSGPLASLVDALTARYALSRSVLEEDVSRLVDEMARRGMVRPGRDE